MKAYIARYKAPNGGNYIAICKDGDKKVHICTIALGTGVTVRAENLSEKRYLQPFPEYSLPRARKQFIEAGKLLGITKTANKFVRSARK